MFRTTWIFDVDPSEQAAFEAMYGPKGDWVRLFERYEGFKETVLLREAEGGSRYATIDVWTSAEAYQNFLDRAAEEYKALGERGKTLVTGMVHAGQSA